MFVLKEYIFPNSIKITLLSEFLSNFNAIVFTVGIERY